MFLRKVVAFFRNTSFLAPLESSFIVVECPFNVFEPTFNVFEPRFNVFERKLHLPWLNLSFTIGSKVGLSISTSLFAVRAPWLAYSTYWLFLSVLFPFISVQASSRTSWWRVIFYVIPVVKEGKYMIKMYSFFVFGGLKIDFLVFFLSFQKFLLFLQRNV